EKDIGGGPHGTGPNSYWIRLQRRLGEAAIAGVTTSSVSAQNVPYLVSTREDDPIVLKIGPRNVGQIVSFRFVPISADGTANENAALVINHRIVGKAFA
ncbi:MAG: hypothetical protein ACM359_03830, partial [Bacillota bacterium]